MDFHLTTDLALCTEMSRISYFFFDGDVGEREIERDGERKRWRK